MRNDVINIHPTWVSWVWVAERYCSSLGMTAPSQGTMAALTALLAAPTRLMASSCTRTQNWSPIPRTALDNKDIITFCSSI